MIHEAGHALAMKRLNIPFGPMVFVPFLGAAVEMRKRPKDAWEEALVAFGGPVLGSAGAFAFAGFAHATSSPLMFALADFGFMINLFNLIPLGSMDGGRICGSISPYAGVVGLGIGGGLAYNGLIANPIFYLIFLGGGYETFMRFYDPLGHAPPNYYNISQPQVRLDQHTSKPYLGRNSFEQFTTFFRPKLTHHHFYLSREPQLRGVISVSAELCLQRWPGTETTCLPLNSSSKYKCPGITNEIDFRIFDDSISFI